MVINHNISAIYAHRQLKFNGMDLQNDIEKLSSGMRINRAADDSAGLALSEKMRAQIKGLKQAARNSEDGISFIQTTEGYLENTQSLLHRIRELAVQSSNGIYNNEDRMQIQVEVSALVDEIDRIASQAQFNGLIMLTGRYSKMSVSATPTASMWFHVGANMNQRERVYIGTMTAKSLGVRDVINDEIITLSTPNDANRAIGTLDIALMKVSKQRADLGAYQTRLQFTLKGDMVGYENLTSAESRIRDTDMAEQTIEFTKDQVLNQTATAMLAQANMLPQQVMQLLR